MQIAIAQLTGNTEMSLLHSVPGNTEGTLFFHFPIQKKMIPGNTEGILKLSGNTEGRTAQGNTQWAVPGNTGDVNFSMDEHTLAASSTTVYNVSSAPCLYCGCLQECPHRVPKRRLHRTCQISSTFHDWNDHQQSTLLPKPPLHLVL